MYSVDFRVSRTDPKDSSVLNIHRLDSKLGSEEQGST